MVYRPEEYKNTIKHPYPTGIKKCEVLIIDTQEWYEKRHWYNTGTNTIIFWFLMLSRNTKDVKFVTIDHVRNT
jgi:hypothetical protein